MPEEGATHGLKSVSRPLIYSHLQPTERARTRENCRQFAPITFRVPMRCYRGTRLCLNPAVRSPETLRGVSRFREKRVSQPLGT